ncbi:MAG TPA: NusG domain II-containing protein [Clostridiales bacterium]|nr:NusG domain II-containing protein [Clostridiales bacterium]
MVSIKPRPGDFALLAIILAIAVVNIMMFMQKKDGSPTALIIKDGKTLQSIKLDEVKERIEIKGQGKYNELIAVENGRIRFEESDCPDKTCVRTGWISRSGQSAVCLPAGIIIKIVGDDISDTDIILK